MTAEFRTASDYLTEPIRDEHERSWKISDLASRQTFVGGLWRAVDGILPPAMSAPLPSRHENPVYSAFTVRRLTSSGVGSVPRETGDLLPARCRNSQLASALENIARSRRKRNCHTVSGKQFRDFSAAFDRRRNGRYRRPKFFTYQ